MPPCDRVPLYQPSATVSTECHRINRVPPYQLGATVSTGCHRINRVTTVSTGCHRLDRVPPYQPGATVSTGYHHINRVPPYQPCVTVSTVYRRASPDQPCVAVPAVCYRIDRVPSYQLCATISTGCILFVVCRRVIPAQPCQTCATSPSYAKLSTVRDVIRRLRYSLTSLNVCSACVAPFLFDELQRILPCETNCSFFESTNGNLKETCMYSLIIVPTIVYNHSPKDYSQPAESCSMPI